ncbi:MAG: DUF5990 family protein [Gemmatimonadales bacterium]
MSREPQPELALRIVIEDPVPGVRMCLQRGRADLVEPTDVTPSAVVFDFAVRLGATRPGGARTLLGPFTQGPPAGRFVYVNSGRRAGQADSCWDRRAKVPLSSIPPNQLEAAVSSGTARLEVRIPGRAQDGGPVCASVKLPAAGWRLSRRSAV